MKNTKKELRKEIETLKARVNRLEINDSDECKSPENPTLIFDLAKADAIDLLTAYIQAEGKMPDPEVIEENN